MLRTRSVIRIIALVAFSLSLISLAEAATSPRVFVSATRGKDSNTATLCTVANPCYSWKAALSVVATGGEVVALDNGTYGAATINKAVTLEGPVGGYTGINVSSGDGIDINAPGATVILRGLTIDGANRSGTIGINATSFGALHIEDCVVNGFSGNGIFVAGTGDSSGPTLSHLFGPAGSHLFIKDTISRNNGGAGIFTATPASVDHVRVEDNAGSGFVVQNATARVRNSVASGNQGTDVLNNGTAVGGGFVAYGTDSSGAPLLNASALLYLDGCVATMNSIGVSVSAYSSFGGTIGAAASLSRCSVTNNVVGLGQTANFTGNGNAVTDMAGTNPGTNLIDDNQSGNSFPVQHIIQ